MTAPIPASTKHARIVHQFSGPVDRLQLREVPSDWHIIDASVGPDLAASVEELRRRATRQGYQVEDGYVVEDWRIVGEWGRVAR